MTSAYSLLTRVHAIDNGDAHVPRLNRRDPTAPRSRTVTHEDAMDYWRAYHALLDPFRLAAARLRRGDPAGLECAVTYLDACPRFFRSGYLAEELMHAVSVGPDPGSYKPLLRDVVARGWPQGPERTCRYVVQLAARVWDESLDHRLAEVEHGGDPRATAWSRRIRIDVPQVIRSRGGQGRLGPVGRVIVPDRS